mmetsp:Transcript_13466/g.24149  ORF Transcript_13466/g.24149 Transcript_13466/m.24149 type:complete len:418 (-) Transcript_13466:456-1709(-)|eukprot:CAMPEP_0182446806 /NCGR_PEP_ID=MMETSP1172-20130603/6403_1 /TAXON_ID=708627 /ORGANISM="Timspurckia oligopyrenoides, Strain CCMP3278" /LENGTH=417 /DNA_ID=CAMNT_0024642899 /DNA_START=129 /DNA_END=1382 /DNA_ORIENTATION=+
MGTVASSSNVGFDADLNSEYFENGERRSSFANSYRNGENFEEQQHQESTRRTRIQRKISVRNLFSRSARSLRNVSFRRASSTVDVLDSNDRTVRNDMFERDVGYRIERDFSSPDHQQESFVGTGLYPTCKWDAKTVKHMVSHRELAPLNVGSEEDEGEECPICCLNYPALNTSACCEQPICTECFLQIRSPPKPLFRLYHPSLSTNASSDFSQTNNSDTLRIDSRNELRSGFRGTRFTSRTNQGGPASDRCPFCKQNGYRVVFRGAKSAQQIKAERTERERVERAMLDARKNGAVQEGMIGAELNVLEELRDQEDRREEIRRQRDTDRSIGIRDSPGSQRSLQRYPSSRDYPVTEPENGSSAEAEDDIQFSSALNREDRLILDEEVLQELLNLELGVEEALFCELILQLHNGRSLIH